MRQMGFAGFMVEAKKKTGGRTPPVFCCTCEPQVCVKRLSGLLELPGSYIIDLIRVGTAGWRSAVRLSGCATIPEVQQNIHAARHRHVNRINRTSIEVERQLARLPFNAILMESGRQVRRHVLLEIRATVPAGRPCRSAISRRVTIAVAPWAYAASVSFHDVDLRVIRLIVVVEPECWPGTLADGKLGFHLEITVGLVELAIGIDGAVEEVARCVALRPDLQHAVFDRVVFGCVTGLIPDVVVPDTGIEAVEVIREGQCVQRGVLTGRPCHRRGSA